MAKSTLQSTLGHSGTPSYAQSDCKIESWGLLLGVEKLGSPERCRASFFTSLFFVFFFRFFLFFCFFPCFPFSSVFAPVFLVLFLPVSFRFFRFFLLFLVFLLSCCLFQYFVFFLFLFFVRFFFSVSFGFLPFLSVSFQEIREKHRETPFTKPLLRNPNALVLFSSPFNCPNRGFALDIASAP